MGSAVMVSCTSGGFKLTLGRLNVDHGSDLEVKLSSYDAMEVELGAPAGLEKVPPPWKAALEAELVALAGLQKILSPLETELESPAGLKILPH